MKLKQLLAAIETRSVKGPVDTVAQGVTCDSRQVRPGYIFVAVTGTRQDGRAFADDAIHRGAAAVVAECPLSGGIKACRVEVDDARRAAALLATEFHGHPSRVLRTVGITGTNGKTTVAYLVRDMLTAAGTATGLISTIEYEIGSRRLRATRTTPGAPELQAMLAEMVRAECHAVVMEVSSHALTQERVTGVEFDAGVFTNLTRDHLDYHETEAAYLEAKTRLFVGLGAGGKQAVAIVNIDDPAGRRIVERHDIAADILTYGAQPDAAVRAERVELSPQGVAFDLITPWGQETIRTALLGRFNVSNLLAACAVCGSLEVPPAVMAATLRQARPVPGRLERIEGKGFQVFVDYAHTDDALLNVLETLREITAGKLIVVFGCGGDRDRSKRPLMGSVAARRADRVVITSDNPRSEDPGAILDDIRQGIDASVDCLVIEDRREAIGRALAMAGKGDVVLVAGKGHETFQELAHRTVSFDDRQVVRELLEG